MSSSRETSSGDSVDLPASSSYASSACLRSSLVFRRSVSIARRFAAVVSQAPGLRGMPSRGHCSSAATSASWARSSAIPTSRTSRVTAAMTFGDSIRQMVSIERCASDVVSASDHIIPHTRCRQTGVVVWHSQTTARVRIQRPGFCFSAC